MTKQFVEKERGNFTVGRHTAEVREEGRVVCKSNTLLIPTTRRLSGQIITY